MMMATPQQLQTALANAQAAGDAQAVQVIQQAMAQMAPTGPASPPTAAAMTPQSLPDPATLSRAYYRAQAAGDEPAKKELFHAIVQQGGHLLPMDAATLAELQQQQNAQIVDNTSGVDNFRAGAGKAFTDTWRGVKQLNALAGTVLDPSNPGYAGQYDELKQEQSDTNTRDKALLASKAGLGGNIFGYASQLLAPAGVLGLAGRGAAASALLPSTLAGTAAQGAGLGLLQPLDADQGEGSRLGNTAIGAAGGLLGAAAPKIRGDLLTRGAGAVVGGLLPKASPEYAAIARSAINDFGIPLKASQVSSSRIGKILDSVSKDVPFSGAANFSQAQQKAFNRAIAKTIGEDADSVTPAIYAQAKSRIGATYDDITARNKIALTPDVNQRLGKLLSDVQATGSDDSIRAVTNLIDRVNSQAVNGAIPGNAYQSIQSELGRIVKNGGEKGGYARQMKGVLSDALGDSISPADQAAWAQANQQYGNLKTIRNLVTKDQVNGDISPKQLLGRVTSNEAKKEAVASGRGGDLSQLASIGSHLIGDQVPNSGTPGRILGLGLLGGAGYANLPAAAMTVAVSRIVQSALKSPQALAKVMDDPSIDQAVKNMIIERLSTAGGLLSQQGALANQRQKQANAQQLNQGLLNSSP